MYTFTPIFSQREDFDSDFSDIRLCDPDEHIACVEDLDVDLVENYSFRWRFLGQDPEYDSLFFQKDFDNCIDVNQKNINDNFLYFSDSTYYLFGIETYDKICPQYKHMDTVKIYKNFYHASIDNYNVSSCEGDVFNLEASVWSNKHYAYPLSYAGYTILWSTGDTTINIAVKPTAYHTTYSVTITDRNIQCPMVDTFDIFISGVDIISNIGDTICSGQSLWLHMVPKYDEESSTTYTYTWDNGFPAEIRLVKPMQTTTYSVTINYNNFCTVVKSKVIYVNNTIANAGPDQTICSGNQAILSASGGDTYSWSTGATSSAVTVNPSQTTTYYLVATKNNCNATDTVIVFVNSTPNVYAGEDKYLCDNIFATTILTATGADHYYWSNNATTNSIVVGVSNKTYTVTGTNINGCSDIDTVTIYALPVPIANAGIDVTICKGDTATLTGSGGTTFTWSNGLTTQTIKVAPAITTTYGLVVANEFGCRSTNRKPVTVNILSANAGPDVSICRGDSVTLTASGGDSYLWSRTYATTQSIRVAPTSLTNYKVTVKINDKGCVSSDEVIVFVGKYPDLSVLQKYKDTVVCKYATFSILSTSGYNYSWSTGVTSRSINIRPYTDTTLYVTATNPTYGCSTTDSVNIKMYPAWVNAEDDFTMCNASGREGLSAKGYMITSYKWNTGQTNTNILINPLKTTTYTVSGYTAKGCVLTDKVVVTLFNDSERNDYYSGLKFSITDSSCISNPFTDYAFTGYFKESNINWYIVGEEDTIFNDFKDSARIYWGNIPQDSFATVNVVVKPRSVTCNAYFEDIIYPCCHADSCDVSLEQVTIDDSNKNDFDFTNTQYCITGYLKIKTSLDISKCIFHVSPEGYIEIDENVTVNIDSSTFLSCGRDMWKGIVLNDYTSNLNISNSTIIDANIGIDIKGTKLYQSGPPPFPSIQLIYKAPTAKMDNVTFINNHIGVNLYNHRASSVISENTDYSGYIKNCKFLYDETNYKPKGSSSGILIDNFDKIVIDSCLFNRVYRGINIYNSNLFDAQRAPYITNNKFYNIMNIVAMKYIGGEVYHEPNYTYCAIYIKGGALCTSNNKFFNCYGGINMYSGNYLYSNKDSMLNIFEGIIVQDCKKDMAISNAYIEASNTSKISYFNPYTGNPEEEYQDFHAKLTSGIFVNKMYSKSNCKITNCRVINFVNGITTYNVNYPSVDLNTFSINNNSIRVADTYLSAHNSWGQPDTVAFRGISAWNTNLMGMYNNTVFSNDKATKARYGAYIKNSPNLRIYDNSFNYITYGLVLGLNLNGWAADCNTFDNCKFGIQFQNAAFNNNIGTFDAPTANRFMDISSKWIVQNDESSPLFVTIYYSNQNDNTDLEGNPNRIAIPAGSINLMGVNKERTCDYPEYLSTVETYRDSILWAYIKDDVINTKSNNQRKFKMDYEKLCLAYRFLDHNKHLMKLHNKKDKDFDKFYKKHKKKNIAKFNEVDNVIMQVADLNTSNPDSASYFIASAIALNNAIVPQNSIEMYQKVVNDIYLHTFIQGIELDSTQNATLLTIAYLDASIYGTPVYYARGMLKLYIEDEDDDMIEKTANDIDTLLPQPKVKAIQNAQEFELYPNPAQNIITVYSQNIDTIVPVTFELYSVFGEQIATYTITQSNQQTFSVANIENGLYLYRIRKNNITFKTGKIVICK